MIFEIGLLVFIFLTVAVIESRDLLWSIIFMAGADIVLAMLFFMMSAPDVAITQVSVVGGLSTLIFLIVIRKTRREGHEN
jgi:energy-converting hydrogenase B subunit D